MLCYLHTLEVGKFTGIGKPLIYIYIYNKKEGPQEISLGNAVGLGCGGVVGGGGFWKGGVVLYLCESGFFM